MSERPREFRDLVGSDVPPEELARLERVDALLRSAPPPPAAIPRSLTEGVREIPRARERRAPRRLVAALAFAALLSLASFALGLLAGGEEGLDERLRVTMEATPHARGAVAVIRVGEKDEESGNYELELEVSGLRELPEGGYYALWLAKDGEYAATCGTFRVGEDETSVYMNVAYDLERYDAWVVTAYLPDEPPDAERPWLLTASI